MLINIIRSTSRVLPEVFRVLVMSLAISVAGHVVFLSGYAFGYNSAAIELASLVEQMRSTETSSTAGFPEPAPTPTPVVIVASPTPRPRVALHNWSGPELWEAVNTRRVQLGVNPLNNQSELCTIASIRLNELLELGKLDGHEGFSSLPERRPDLKWIFDKYSISEFLVSGASSAQDAVALWENTLGHSKLLTGGEYVWGCTYAQNSFGVAISAY